MAKFLRANKCKGFRGLRVYAVAFLAFDKGFYSLLRGKFLVSLDFFAPYFKLVAFIANLKEVMQNTYLQLCNNRVCFGNGLEWTPQMEAK